MSTIGKRIREIREKRGWTQKLLAEKAQLIETTIRKYELGIVEPKYENMKKIADALGVSELYLMGKKDESLIGHSMASTIRKSGLSFVECARKARIPADRFYRFCKGEHAALTKDEQERVAQSLGLQDLGELYSRMMDGIFVDLGLMEIDVRKILENHDVTSEEIQAVIDYCRENFEVFYKEKHDSEMSFLLWLLSEEGKKEAKKRVMELTDLEKYQAWNDMPPLEAPEGKE